MTKHAAYPSEDVVAAGAVPAPASRHFTSFPLLKGAPLDCKKHADVDLSASGDAIMCGSWFESMKASSPRCADDAEHGDWMEKHPSALAQFETMLAAAEGKHMVMFLDYDGTVSPIVEDPDRAVMSEEMREAVRSVAEHFPTAIVSGRCRDKVFNFVKLPELYYAGSHGMDIQGPANHLQATHAAFAADDAITAAAAFTSAPAAAQPGRQFMSFPPPMASGGCRVAAAACQATDPVAAGVAAASWPDLNDWMEKHPSALAEFESVLSSAKGKQIVMFLDYDGTLSPIVKDPDTAVMSEEMRDAVRGVAEHFPTAIVSGRCRDKVFNFVKLTELYYAGSHGMDIQGPANHLQANAQVVHYQAGSEFLPVIQEVFGTLTAKMAAIAGAKVENNKYCLSIHFRCVREEDWNAVNEEVRSVLKEYPNLKLTHGRKVLEIRPSIKWDKGKALEFLLKSLGYAGRNDIFPIYIGDDRTDEDAFKVLRSMGQGIGILVSKLPKETAASYSLSDPAEVKEFLRKLAKSAKGDTPTLKMMT